jgi:hypothetical protein
MTTVPIFSDMMRLLLEGTPIDSVDTVELFNAITKVSLTSFLNTMKKALIRVHTFSYQDTLIFIINNVATFANNLN